jgi:radical SAM superfamily enzyme YgiQ (UPF0313 family)
MKVLVISTNRNLFPVPVIPLGACIAAEAAERAGHNVKLLDLMFAKDPLGAIEAAIARTGPDVIGLSVRNIDNNDMQRPEFFMDDVVRVLDVIRAKTDAPVVLGGSAVSVMPEEIMRHTGVSCAVLGDGETVFPALLEVFPSDQTPHEIPGTAWMADNNYFSYPCNFSSASDSCLCPEFSRWIDIRKYLAGLAAVPLQTKLGCHFSCVYCTYRKIEGSTYRLFDRTGVVESVKRLSDSGLRQIEFVDNVFNSPYGHAVSLCEDLARIRHNALLYSLELNPFHIDDALLSAMERAGFRGIGITAESASDKVLSSLGKGYDAASVRRAAEVVGRHNLPCVWIFMLGGPGETNETILETLRFAETSIRPTDTAFFNLGVRIYPGTELEAIARRQGVLSLPKAEMLRPVFYVSPEVNSDRMIKKVKESLNSHMNFINSDSIGLSFLPYIHRLAYKLGMRTPLWKYTRYIRRGLRAVGVDA